METPKQYKAHVFGEDRFGDAVKRIGNTTIFEKIQFYYAEADTKTDSDNFLANFFEYKPGSGYYKAGEISYPIDLSYNGEPLSLSEKNDDMDAQ